MVVEEVDYDDVNTNEEQTEWEISQTNFWLDLADQQAREEDNSGVENSLWWIEKYTTTKLVEKKKKAIILRCVSKKVLNV